MATFKGALIRFNLRNTAIFTLQIFHFSLNDLPALIGEIPGQFRNVLARIGAVALPFQHCEALHCRPEDRLLILHILAKQHMRSKTRFGLQSPTIGIRFEMRF